MRITHPALTSQLANAANILLLLLKGSPRLVDEKSRTCRAFSSLAAASEECKLQHCSGQHNVRGTGCLRPHPASIPLYPTGTSSLGEPQFTLI